MRSHTRGGASSSVGRMAFSSPGIFARPSEKYTGIPERIGRSSITILCAMCAEGRNTNETSSGPMGSTIGPGPIVLPIGPEDVSLVFLPSAHIAQRIVMELLPMRSGMPVYFSEGLAKMPGELKAIRPTLLLAPPRVWERIYSSICTEIRKRPAPIRKLFYGALGLGLRAAHLRHEGKPIPG